MIIKMRTVTVHEIPEEVTASEERRFLEDLQQYVETERPRLVLDCSRVRKMDNAAIHLLLSCLEEAMKRNGDVKLAGLDRDAKAALSFTGANHLFEVFPTAADAVRSFQRRSGALAPAAFEAGAAGLASENVA